MEQQLTRKTRLRMGSIIAVLAAVSVMTLQRVGVTVPGTQGLLGTLVVGLGLGGALVLATDRDSYLPFLGEAAFPLSMIALSTPKNTSLSVQVSVPPGASHVVYWASESSTAMSSSPRDAYGTFGNAGVVAANSDGTATLPLRCPGDYKVPVRGALPKHVHFRGIYPEGILGRVQTRGVTC